MKLIILYVDKCTVMYNVSKLVVRLEVIFPVILQKHSQTENIGKDVQKKIKTRNFLAEK